MKSYRVTVNGQSYDVQVEELGGAPAVASPSPARNAPAAAPAPAAAQSPASGGAALVKAPMPGTLMAYKVAVGQAVRKGDVVLILEAMKMENEIVAPSDGSVKSLGPAEGASVNTGDLLVELA